MTTMENTMHIVYTHISKILLTRKRELCRWRIRKAQKKNGDRKYKTHKAL